MIKYLKSIQNFLTSNIRNVIIFISIIFLVFIFVEVYNFFNSQKLKETSIKFFNTIENIDETISNLEEIKSENNFYAILSNLKLIQKYNESKNYSLSNQLYKDVINSEVLDNLYISSIATHASYTLINASYEEKTNKYLNDISFFIDKISNEFQSYFSIKKELEYLLVVTEIDIINSDYKNNQKALNIYNEIVNSDLISSSIKERVKKIHEFQLYK